MNQDPHTAPPKTIEEIGIHLIYMSQELKELKDVVKEMPNGFASIKDLGALATRVTVLENRNNLKNTVLWVGLVASAIINIIALYNIFTNRT